MQQKKEYKLFKTSKIKKRLVAMCDSNIINLATDEKESNVYFVDMEITTRNRVHFADIMRKIRHMDQVQKVSRHSQNKHN